MKKALVCLVTLLASTALLAADFNTGFEAPDYTGDADGELLTGQQSWYLPVAGSKDFNVFTFKDNVYGVVQNPRGGDQFAAGRSNGGTELGRGQHDFDFSTQKLWNVRFDMAMLFNGTLPTADNLGSFSLQPSASSRYFQTLYTWVDVNKAENFNANYLWWNADGVQQAFTIPGDAWRNLSVNHWYSQSTLIDFESNKILRISITDLHAGTTTSMEPDGWYMTGGKSPTQPLPTAFRIFAGGAAGNISAWDNIAIPEPASLSLLVLGLAVGVARRR